MQERLAPELWGSHGEFVIDGNLSSVENADRLASPGLFLRPVGDFLRPRGWLTAARRRRTMA